MNLYDMLGFSVGNLARIKLRAILTISGIVIAIAAFVALLSFGAGSQKYIEDFYNEFGLLSTIYVYPQKNADLPDTVEAKDLNNKALKELTEIPGVVAAYPFVSFDASVSVLDTQFTAKARALPVDASQSQMFSRILGDNIFSSDSALEVVVTHEFLELIEIEDPDSIIGEEIVLSVQSASLDSALINIVKSDEGHFVSRLKGIEFDSLRKADYRERVIRRELNEGLRRFVDGLMTRTETVADTLTIIGIGAPFKKYDINFAPIIVPVKTAQKLTTGSFGLSSDPVDLMTAMQSGTLFSAEEAADSRQYNQVTLSVEPYASHSEIMDSVKAMGYRTFSFAEQFKQMQKMFIYFNLGLGLIGLIALITAALGIINTMVMSIIERRKEIGVIKSLGADERDIKFMYLAESAVIGAVGSIVGILLGWLGTRVASEVGRIIMEREDMPVFDPFALPLWLVVTAFAFGVLVSLIAGYYPAARAARVDPVEALRSE